MKSRPRPFRRLVFFLPVIIVAAVVSLAIFTIPTTGTLVVRAETSGRYYPAYSLTPEATVGTSTLLTPFNMTLAPGTYSVTYASVPGFVTPASRGITVLPGRPAFAVGVYDPVLKVVQATANGFNSTAIDAIHGVTPVVWLNQQPTELVLNIEPIGRVIIPAGGNFTHVFTQSGSFSFNFFFDNTIRGTVTVA